MNDGISTAIASTLGFRNQNTSLRSNLRCFCAFSSRMTKFTTIVRPAATRSQKVARTRTSGLSSLNFQEQKCSHPTFTRCGFYGLELLDHDIRAFLTHE